MDEIKERYRELMGKYPLPGYDELDYEFSIHECDDKFVLRAIRNKIESKLIHFAKIFDEMLNPETSISGMHEAKSIPEEDRDEIFQIYKQLLFYLRTIDLLYLNDSDQLNAEFINKFFAEWKNIKMKISKYMLKLQDAWRDNLDSTYKVNYLG